jgi:MFS family permease
LYAFGQEITEKENYGKTNSLFEIQGQATTIVGGAVGSILLTGTEHGSLNLMGFKMSLPFDIPKWELHEIFLMDGITYIISIVLLLMIKYTPTTERVIHTGTISERIRMGVSYLKKNPLIFWFGNLSHSIFVILLVEVHFLLPLYINNHLHEGADIYASSDIYYAIGALMAGIGIRNLFRNTSAVRAVIIMMWLTVAGLLIVAFTKSLLLFFIFSFLIGITNAGTRVLRITYLFNHIPNTYMGRAGSVFQVLNILLRSLFIGIFSIPFFAKDANITWAYFIGAIFIIISVLPLSIKLKEFEKAKGADH